MFIFCAAISHIPGGHVFGVDPVGSGEKLSNAIYLVIETKFA